MPKKQKKSTLNNTDRPVEDEDISSQASSNMEDDVQQDAKEKDYNAKCDQILKELRDIRKDNKEQLHAVREDLNSIAKRMDEAEERIDSVETRLQSGTANGVSKTSS